MKSNREILQILMSRIRNFFFQWKIFDFSVAFWEFLFSFNRRWGRLEVFIDAHKHRAILRYLIKHYADYINQFAREPVIAQESTIDPKSTIWICWWDGIESMPAIVNACYHSILQHAGTHSVQLITKNNFRNFVSIPEYILEKVDVGIITITHFSDILRAALLYEHGGIWLDATILALKNISLSSLPFFTLKTTLKTDSITHIRWQGISYSRFTNPVVPEINRWTGFFLAGTKHDILFEFMRGFFYAYWKERQNLIDYLFIDYVIDIAYDTIPSIKKMFDDVPYSEIDIYMLENILNDEFSNERFAQCSAMNFHKLTWKKSFNIYTQNNKLTVYGHILKTYLHTEMKI